MLRCSEWDLQRPGEPGGPLNLGGASVAWEGTLSWGAALTGLAKKNKKKVEEM